MQGFYSDYANMVWGGVMFLTHTERCRPELVEPHAGDDEQWSPADALFSGERKALVAKAIGALPEKEKRVLAVYYQEEFKPGKKMWCGSRNVSESRVSQLHSSRRLSAFVRWF